MDSETTFAFIGRDHGLPIVSLYFVLQRRQHHHAARNISWKYKQIKNEEIQPYPRRTCRLPVIVGSVSHNSIQDCPFLLTSTNPLLQHLSPPSPLHHSLVHSPSSHSLRCNQHPIQTMQPPILRQPIPPSYTLNLINLKVDMLAGDPISGDGVPDLDGDNRGIGVHREDLVKDGALVGSRHCHRHRPSHLERHPYPNPSAGQRSAAAMPDPSQVHDHFSFWQSPWPTRA